MGAIEHGKTRRRTASVDAAVLLFTQPVQSLPKPHAQHASQTVDAAVTVTLTTRNSQVKILVKIFHTKLKIFNTGEHIGKKVKIHDTR